MSCVRPTDHSLHALFIAAVLAAAAGASVTGCNSSDQTLENPGELTAPFSCVAVGDYQRVHTTHEGYEALRSALGLDYLAWRQEGLSEPSDAGGGGESIVDEQYGVACRRAGSAEEGCLAQVAALRAPGAKLLEAEYPYFGYSNYLVYTRGIEVGSVVDRAQLLALLGAIDHPAKAWLVARERGLHPLCDQAWIREDADGFVMRAEDQISDSPYTFVDVLLRIDRAGNVTELERGEERETGGVAGRRPAGVALLGYRGTDAGAYLAHVAQLEAASIDAFYILRDELAAHGAPLSLIDAAERAARDEIRHARTMDRLAARFGAPASARPTVSRGPVRSLEAIALENAREGCVREAYGALEATWQSLHAEDVAVKRALCIIARDETEHAELAFRVAAWLETKLDAAANARVRAARDAAFGELESELRGRRLVRNVGLPARAPALALLESLRGLDERLAARDVAPRQFAGTYSASWPAPSRIASGEVWKAGNRP